MGIYIFKWKALKKFLKQDELNKNSSNDFGKDIIPSMVAEDKRLYAYRFKGQWKDVGTIDSLWESNVDLLDDDCSLNIYDSNWRIYSQNPTMPPQYIGNEAEVQQSIIVEGCNVFGSVKNSVLFSGVSVGKGSKITNSVIMNNVTIGENVIIDKAIIGANAIIRKGSRVGDGIEIAVVGDHEELKANTVLAEVREVI